MNNFKTFALLALAAPVIAFANPTAPAGTEGKDYAMDSFTIGSGGAVVVSATNITTTSQSGNKARIVLYVNGVAKLDQTVDKATFSTSYTVSGNGAYDVTAVCYNERADAHSCSINLAKKEVKTF